MTLSASAVVPLIVVALSTMDGACAARHGRAIVGGSTVPNPSGTISGNVKTSWGEPLQGRRVTAVEVVTGSRYGATTSVGGGYTIQVPEGKYRLEVELHGSETVVKQPAPTSVHLSDLDEQLDFTVAP